MPIHSDQDRRKMFWMLLFLQRPPSGIGLRFPNDAAYHKGPDVRNFLARPGSRLHLIQLTPYCPHHNRIERLWTVMHQHVTYNRHYPTQKQFAGVIPTFCRKTMPQEWTVYRDKVTDSFRAISHGQFWVSL
ncbi:transposase [Celeribacter halophilus]|uniref:transposase n=1 Tax=Celeribacter halophilus TaxID=576117 RepID=UPI003A8DE615